MSLTIGKLKIKSANFNGVSSLPPLTKMINVQQLRKSFLLGLRVFIICIPISYARPI